ncbi:MAG TPA: SagB/ThcOx family dehydrogenase [Pirellulales bacterium]|nr:SagB/ThcOx family dehydrogenase [Pirellulales bacterium]
MNPQRTATKEGLLDSPANSPASTRFDCKAMKTAASSIADQTNVSLAEVLMARRSCREFATEPLNGREVSNLCWAAQGVTDRAAGFRTAPSAGALYPLTLFVVDGTGVFEYSPTRQTLTPRSHGDVRRSLQDAAFDQPCVGDAPACLVIVMDLGISVGKYRERAERYCLLEAGHVAQNVLLQATALGLGAVPVGAFDDDRVADVLKLPNRFHPLYLIPVGHPSPHH